MYTRSISAIQVYHSCTLTLLSTLIRSLKYYSLCYCLYRCSARARSTAGRAMSLWAMLRSSEEKGLSSSRDSAREKEVELQLTKQESTMEGWKTAYHLLLPLLLIVVTRISAAASTAAQSLQLPPVFIHVFKTFRWSCKTQCSQNHTSVLKTLRCFADYRRRSRLLLRAAVASITPLLSIELAADPQCRYCNLLCRRSVEARCEKLPGDSKIQALVESHCN